MGATAPPAGEMNEMTQKKKKKIRSIYRPRVRELYSDISDIP